MGYTPPGSAMYALEIRLDAGTVPVSVNLYASINGSFDNWIDSGPGLLVWHPITQQIEIAQTFAWKCEWRRSHLYWRSGTLTTIDLWGAAEWTLRDKDSWSLAPNPPSTKNYTFLAAVGDILAVAIPLGRFTLVSVCGPGNPQGIPVKVVGVTPV